MDKTGAEANRGQRPSTESGEVKGSGAGAGAGGNPEGYRSDEVDTELTTPTPTDLPARKSRHGPTRSNTFTRQRDFTSAPASMRR